MVDGLEKRGSEEALRDKYKEPIISGGKKKKKRKEPRPDGASKWILKEQGSTNR